MKTQLRPAAVPRAKARDPDRAAYAAALAEPAGWPVLTIMEPWASLIAGQYKLVENRSWKTNYRGPILIHAGVGTKFLPQTAVFREQGYRLPDPLPFGRVVAVAQLLDCVPRAELPPRWSDDPFAEGPWCWCLGAIVPITAWVPMTGKLKLFAPPPLVLDQCRAAVAAAYELPYSINNHG